MLTDEPYIRQLENTSVLKPKFCQTVSPVVTTENKLGNELKLKVRRIMSLNTPDRCRGFIKNKYTKFL
jgi:hypothetical protein